MSTVICVASGKGGTGKTSVSAGISSCLAALGRTVCALDADVGLRNLDLALGLNERAVFDFSDVIMQRTTISHALVSHSKIPNLWLLAAPFGMSEEISKEQMQELVNSLRTQFDYCIIDCPAGIGKWLDIIASLCDRCIVVATPDNASLRDAGITRKAIRASGVSDIRLVINRVRPKLITKKRAVNLDDAIDITGIQLLGIVPEDQTVISCANHGEPVILQTKSRASTAYKNITRRLIGDRIPIMKLPKKLI